jgi:predicted O-methyltransferase YrrM
MLGDGLPQRLEPALRFLFDGQAPESAVEASRAIEGLRARISERDDVYRYAWFDTSLGVVRLAQRAEKSSASMSSSQYAMAISVPKRWGIFLYLCATAFNAKNILEMGACVGISGAYLASIRSQPDFLTLEGSQVLAAIAQTTLAAVSDKAHVVVGLFEDTLPRTLERIARDGQTIDLAYVDGHHGEAATLHYVDAISRRLSSTALIILDDIYLYEDMWRAWQKLSSAAGVVSINVGRFGLVMYGSSTPCRQYDLARYTGFWRVGSTRARAIANP